MFKSKLVTHLLSLAGVLLIISTITTLLPNQLLIKDLQPKTAQASSNGPTLQVKVRDHGCTDQEGSSPAISPPVPGVQVKASATDYNAKDPDCASIQLIPGNISVSNGLQSIYSKDFRLGISLAESENGCTNSEGSVTWTGWASEGMSGTSTTLTSPVTSGVGGMVSADCVKVWYETRAMPEGKAIGDIQFGIKVGGGTMQYSPLATSGGGWSPFSSTGDFTTAQVSIKVTTVAVPNDADYVSTTIPQNPTATYPTGNPAGSTLGNLTLNSTGNYQIVMKNQGGTWPSDVMTSRSLISANPTPPGNSCEGWTPTATGQTCTEQRVLSSSQYKLRRIDSNTSAIQTPSGDLPYTKTVQYTYTSREVFEIVCHDMTPGDPFGRIDPEPTNCGPESTSPPTFVVNPPTINPIEDVLFDATATFPLSVTALTAGDYELRFQMVKTGGRGVLFGDASTNPETVAVINVRVGNPWTLTCGVGQYVTQGQSAYFPVSAQVPSGYNSAISVTMTASPTGPAMQTSPLSLNPSNVPLPYLDTAVIPTGSLTPSLTYTLTFHGTDGTYSQDCSSTLVVNNEAVFVYLLANGSEGPIEINAKTAELSWTSDSANSCSGSMVSGADTSSPTPWTGPQATANIDPETFQVSNLVPGSSYTFRITCTGTYGAQDTDDVTVTTTNSPSDPTVDLKCYPDPLGGKSPTDGPCEVPYGSYAELSWSSTNATSCTLTPSFGSVPTSSAGSNTPNLTASTTFTINCLGDSKSNPTSDNVRVNVISTPPTAPITVQALKPNCGQIDIQWSNGVGGQTPQFYRVYRNTTGNDGDFAQIGADVPYQAGAGVVYLLTDTAPSSESNYYAVRSWNGTAPSAYIHANTYPIAPDACTPNPSQSDKDVVGVVGRITKNFSPTPCSGTSEVAVLPNNALFAPGDVVTFQINVCNTGTQPMTGVQVTDTYSNLSNLTVLPSSVKPPCVTGSTVGPSSVTITMSDIPATNGVCAVQITGVATAPSSPSAAIYRFQNKALITADGGISQSVFTPPYLFNIAGGVPDRDETAPVRTQ